MRSGRSFRMILNAENRLALVSHAFDGPVVQIDAIDRNIGRQRGWIDERAVTLESLLAMRRAGADLLITYAAKDVARWLKEGAA